MTRHGNVFTPDYAAIPERILAAHSHPGESQAQSVHNAGQSAPRGQASPGRIMMDSGNFAGARGRRWFRTVQSSAADRIAGPRPVRVL